MTYQRDRRYAGKPPGGKGSPRVPIARIWKDGGSDFRRVTLECGHDVRLTKGYEWKVGMLVPCPFCPKRKGRK